MSLKIFFFALISLNLQAASKDLEKFCQGKIQAANFKKQAITNCNLAGGLAAGEDVQLYAKEIAAKKLITLTADQIKQSLQNLALNDQFFNSINMPLLRSEDSELKSSCRLDNFNNLDRLCGKDQKANPARIKLIQAALGFNSGTLKQNLSKIFLSNLGQGQEAKSCPVAGAGQGFLMKGQLDNESHNILEMIKINNDVFDRYPQLKLLGDAHQKTAFLEFAAAQTTELSDRELVATFYKNHPEIDFRKPILEQCNETISNMREVVCDQIPEPLTLNQQVNSEIFNFDVSTPSMEDQMESGEDTYLGFALHCQYLNKCKNDVNCPQIDIEAANIISKKDTQEKKNIYCSPYKKEDMRLGLSKLDKKFLCLDNSLRKVKTSDDDQLAKTFCSHYSCSSDEVKKTLSCQKGGPLSLDDFKVTFDCPKGNLCTKDKKLMYSYLKNYEAEQIRIGEWKKTHGKVTSAETPALYSSFVENFLGVEQTLVAEGRPVTAEAVKQKEEQFKKRGLSTGAAVADASTSATSESAVAKTSIKAPSASTDAKTSVGENQNYNSWTSNSAQVSDTPSRSTKTEVPKKLADVSKDSQDMRQELEDMINSIKGSKKDKLNTVTDNNSNYVPAADGGMMNDSGLSRSEKRRIDDLRRQLDQLNAPKPTANNTPNAAYDEQSQQAAEAMAARPKTDDYGYDPKKAAAATLAASSGKGGTTSRAPANEEGGAVVEKLVKSEDLPKLSIEELRELGFKDSETFVIKVLHENRLIEIPVKKFSIDGKTSILAPVFNSSNSRLSTLVLKSPLFSEYREYQIKRAQDRRASGMNDALNSTL